MSRRYWIIGASSGIGYALAQRLLQDGHQVAMSARNTESLDALHATYAKQALVIRCDVTDADSVAAAVAIVGEQWAALDVAIYNAGICEYVDDGIVSSAVFQRVIDTNLIGLARVTEHVLPVLQLGERPQLVGVSSSAAYLPLPRAEYYGASKAAMSYFLHTLRLAWQRKGITVHVVSPGFVKTPLTDKNDFAMPCQITAELAAEYIVEGIEARQRDIHFPRRFTLWLKLLGALPLYIQQQLTGRLQKQ